ncbi:574_t:CDS:2 [Entrophospora sp. SA101]|nr:4597_t:CDS:2 [Entrophospora sp. SA101]CAJ0911421.1 574_t:CDS:2 [Entrophospora sp. SA101]
METLQAELSSQNAYGITVTKHKENVIVIEKLHFQNNQASFVSGTMLYKSYND